MLDILATAAAFAVKQIEFEIVEIRRGRGERVDGGPAKRRAAKVGMNEHACAINDWLNARTAHFFGCKAQSAHDSLERWNGLLLAEGSEFTSDKADQRGAGQILRTESLQQLLDSRDCAQ